MDVVKDSVLALRDSYIRWRHTFASTTTLDAAYYEEETTVQPTSEQVVGCVWR